MRFVAGAFPWFGLVNGYVAARLFTFFHGSNWMILAFCTSCFLPTFMSAFLIVIDACEWIETGKADTLPAREACFLGAVWLCIHVPSAYLGSYWGFSQKPI